MAMPAHPSPPIVPEPRRYSVAEVLEFPSDGNRYEVVAGELLVSPAPRDRHQLIILRLVLALADYLRPLGLVELIRTAPADPPPPCSGSGSLPAARGPRRVDTSPPRRYHLGRSSGRRRGPGPTGCIRHRAGPAGARLGGRRASRPRRRGVVPVDGTRRPGGQTPHLSAARRRHLLDRG